MTCCSENWRSDIIEYSYIKKCVIQTLYFATFRLLNYNISTHRKLGYTTLLQYTMYFTSQRNFISDNICRSIFAYWMKLQYSWDQLVGITRLLWPIWANFPMHIVNSMDWRPLDQYVLRAGNVQVFYLCFRITITVNHGFNSWYVRVPQVRLGDVIL